MARVHLDDTIYFRNWKKSTDRLRKSIQDKLDSIQKEADKKRKQAEEIEAKRDIYQAQIAYINTILPPKKQPIVNAENKWHPDYDACIKCHRNTVQYSARGLCASCYTYQNKAKNALQSETVPEEPE